MTDEPNSPTDAEQFVMEQHAGRQLLDQMMSVAQPSVTQIDRWRKQYGSDQVSAGLRLALARRRASGKFTHALEMWLDSTGLEQASDERVARYKAARFRRVAGSEPVFDLCCGIGMDAIALAEGGPVLAVDRDHERCRRARWNLGVYEVSARALVVCADVERMGSLNSRWVHVDPDRRAGRDRRARSVADYAPGLSFLKGLQQAARGGGIKLSPASDFELHFGGPELEIELVSLAGECKEATVWFGAAATCRRRATVLPAQISFCDLDASDQSAAPVEQPGDWIYTPDPALVRAGLLDRFGALHGLKRVGPGVDWLTGRALESPFLARFAVRAVLPFDLKRLKRELNARQLVPQTIKVWGLDVSPEDLRRRLSGGEGGQPTTLLLYLPQGTGCRVQAVIADRC